MKNMKKIVIFIFAAILLLISYDARAGGVVVLIYHKIGNPKSPTTNVSIKRFKEQMEYLKTHHYSVIPLKEMISDLKRHQHLCKKGVVITIDDGYKSVYNNAFPILKKYHYPFSVFLPTESIQYHYPAYMNLKQIKEMMQYGADFESHSYAHSHMAYMKNKMSMKNYKLWIRSDLKKSILFFKKNFGYRPIALAFPYGDYNKILIETAKKLGFECLLTQDMGSVDENTPLWLIPREPILGTYFATMEHFKKILKIKHLDIKERYPEIGILHGNHRIIGAKVANINEYKQNTFVIYTTICGWQKASINKDTVYIPADHCLNRKKLRIGIKAREKNSNSKAMNMWMVINR